LSDTCAERKNEPVTQNKKRTGHALLILRRTETVVSNEKVTCHSSSHINLPAMYSEEPRVVVHDVSSPKKAANENETVIAISEDP